MKVLLSWLWDFLPQKWSADEVAEALLSAGIEVDRVSYLGDGFDHVVMAKIVSFTRHPQADRLSLCEVTDGTEKYEVVCGATNFKAGDHVLLAKVGAKLPNGTQIKRSKIRGVTSEGMLCSGAELGISPDSDGILTFSSDIPLGASGAKVLGREDWLLELELTPNRGDCLSVVGVAREVAAAFGVGAKVPTMNEVGPNYGKSTLKVQVEDQKGAPRYVLRQIDSLKTGSSPLWMTQRLENGGVRPLNNLVDITNYVLLERGQPLHAFDADKIDGLVTVRRANQGEKIKCLDEETRALKPTDLVIADETGPIAIAGVMGGERTAVDEKTEKILLESAHFDPKSIRVASRRLGLSTDSSYRFERWVDPSAVWSSANRAVELFAELAGGRELEGLDVRSQEFAPRPIRLRSQAVKRILGEEIPGAGEYLSRLGFQVEKADDGWAVEVPVRRWDLTREIDLIEEVARVHGYSKFPTSLPPIEKAPVLDDPYAQIHGLKDLCRTAGLREVQSYSFSDRAGIDQFPVEDLGEPISMVNPLVADERWMRRSLLPGLIRAWKFNLARQLKGVGLFEIGRGYGKIKGNGTPQALERSYLGAIWGGEAESAEWYQTNRDADFFDAKGFVELLAKNLGVGPVIYSQDGASSVLHPGQSATILWRKRKIGEIGLLHPGLARKLEVKNLVVVNICLEPWLATLGETGSFREPSAYPVMERDLAFIVSKEVKAEQISQETRKLKDPLLTDVHLFDIYEGKGMGKNERSLAYTFTFGSRERTLTDKEVDASVKKIVAQMKTSLDARLRS